MSPCWSQNILQVPVSCCIFCIEFLGSMFWFLLLCANFVLSTNIKMFALVLMESIVCLFCTLKFSYDKFVESYYWYTSILMIHWWTLVQYKIRKLLIHSDLFLSTTKYCCYIVSHIIQHMNEEYTCFIWEAFFEIW